MKAHLRHVAWQLSALNPAYWVRRIWMLDLTPGEYLDGLIFPQGSRGKPLQPRRIARTLPAASVLAVAVSLW